MRPMTGTFEAYTIIALINAVARGDVLLLVITEYTLWTAEAHRQKRVISPLRCTESLLDRITGLLLSLALSEEREKGVKWKLNIELQ